MKRWSGLLAAFGLALFMGVVAAPAASANTATMSADVRCDVSGGGARIVWTFTNDTESPVAFTLVSNEGGKVKKNVASAPAAPAGGTSTGKGAQSGIDQTLETASLTVLATWEDGETQELTGTAAIAATCGPDLETPEAPAIQQSPACDVAGKLIIPESPFADYLLDGELVSGVLDGPISGTVTAEPKDGYELTGTTTWEVNIAAAAECEDNSVTPVEPTIVLATCDVEGALTVPATENVSYFWNGEPIEAGTVEGPLSGVLTATAAAGFVLEGTDSWTVEIAAAEACPTTPPTTPPGTPPTTPQAPSAVPDLPNTPVLAYTGVAGSAWLALIGGSVVLLGLGLRLGSRRLGQVA